MIRLRRTGLPAENCKASAADTVSLSVTEAVGRPRQLNHEQASVTTLDDFVIEVKDVSRLAALTSARYQLELHGSFWQAAMENGRYVTPSCGRDKKKYILFDVFVPSSEERAAQIAVKKR